MVVHAPLELKAGPSDVTTKVQEGAPVLNTNEMTTAAQNLVSEETADPTASEVNKPTS